MSGTYYTIAEVAKALDLTKGGVRYRMERLPQDCVEKDADGVVRITQEGAQKIAQMPSKKPRSYRVEIPTIRTVSTSMQEETANCPNSADSNHAEARLSAQTIEILHKEIESLMRQNETLARALEAQTATVRQLTEQHESDLKLLAAKAIEEPKQKKRLLFGLFGI